MHAVRWLASPRQGELTHTRSVCVGVAETGVEHRSPAKNHTFKKTTEN